MNDQTPPLNDAIESPELQRPNPTELTLVTSSQTSGDMATAAIKYRFARLLTTTVALLAIIFGTPFLVQQIQYSLEYGRIIAKYDAAAIHIDSQSIKSISLASELVSYKVTPSVVHIHTSTTKTVSRRSFQHPFAQSNLFPSRGQGSGVIVDAEGYIITNRHVIQGAELIHIQLHDKTEQIAVVVGVDRLTDLALLKITPTSMPPIEWPTTPTTNVGTMVWAIGSPFGLERTLTFGIVSATRRTAKVGTVYQEFLQTDVAINPGNSGGPLVNEHGELVGINTAIVGDAYQGISFAVPAHVVKSVYERLKENGVVSRGWLGLALEDVTAEFLQQRGVSKIDFDPIHGTVITSFPQGLSPAKATGLLVGDILIRFNTTDILDTSHLIQLVGAQQNGDQVTITYIRDGAPETASCTLGLRPAE
ncbi:MAG: trypsin-like serine protease [Planctomycetaceae bacterium]|jgi:serine protease Do|nr:trypsin-like serine protease [Planctomycetaceae bacterium]MBT4011816.1 trypsin-like serine protease [Planctomycetaceae bacterium]MBT4725508.1 trypsin-like serine protease [Planctomycetaceae bacterium]MBT4845983.1 trypsin-like serine protease [Planctomycetaceae bacterium]MBT5125510.1 trypsin-like serine protease [Planctomycetaceae bacterium]